MLLGELFLPVHVNQPETPTKYKKKVPHLLFKS